MSEWKKLPATEFELMKAVWDLTPPVTTGRLMDQVGVSKGWKTPTLISFLNRLMEKGFLRSDKQGKERRYYPLVDREEYLRFETQEFVKEYHGNSLVHLVNTLYGGKNLEDRELDELMRWVRDRRE